MATASAAAVIDFTQGEYSIIVPEGTSGPPYKDCTEALQAGGDVIWAAGGGQMILPATNPQAGLEGLPQYRRPPGWDLSNVTIRGAGPGLCTIAGFNCGPQFGVGRLLNGKLLTANSLNFWPPSAGVLDASAGQRWALRTSGIIPSFGDDTPWALGPPVTTSPFDHSRWGGVQQLTWEVCLQPNGRNAGFTTFPGDQGPIGGMIAPVGGAAPFYAWYWTGWCQLVFTTADGVQRKAGFTIPTGKPFLHLAIQPDLANGAIYAGIDGQWVPVTYDAPIPVGSRLAANDTGIAFNIGAVHPSSGTGWNWDGGGPYDQTFHGFKLSKGMQYVPARSGPMVRVDSQPNTDNLRYFAREPNTIACLPLDDAGNAYRQIRAQTGYDYDVWGILSSPGLNEYGSTTINVEGVTFLCGSANQGAYGSAVRLGSQEQAFFSKCGFSGGAKNLGQHYLFADAEQYFTDCIFDGASDAGIGVARGITRLTNSKVNNWGKHCVTSLGGGVRIDYMLAAPSYYPNAIPIDVWDDSSGVMLDVHGFYPDQEAGFLVAHMRIQNIMGGAVTLNNFTAQNNGPGPIIVLTDHPQSQPATLTAISSYQRGGKPLTYGGVVGAMTPVPPSWSVRS